MTVGAGLGMLALGLAVAAMVVAVATMRWARRQRMVIWAPELHEWIGWDPVEEDDVPEQWARVDVTCGHCGEDRRVWRGVDRAALARSGAPCPGRRVTT